MNHTAGCGISSEWDEGAGEQRAPRRGQRPDYGCRQRGREPRQRARTVPSHSTIPGDNPHPLRWLGIVFVPYGTVMDLLSWKPTGISGWDWLLIALGLVLDVMYWVQVGANRRSVRVIRPLRPGGVWRDPQPSARRWSGPRRTRAKRKHADLE